MRDVLYAMATASLHQQRGGVSRLRLEHGTLFGYQGSPRPPRPSRCSPLPPPRPNPPHVQAAFDRIEAHLKHRYVDAGRFRGNPASGLPPRARWSTARCRGFADVERKAPVRDDTIFRIYSMTKPITSVAFMMLVEEGRVALDEPVHKYIAEWKNLGGVPSRHSTGLSDQAAVAADADRRPFAPHLRPDLWLPAALQRRCRLPRIESRRGREIRNAAIDDRGPRQNSAGVFPGRSLELFGLHRCDRLSRRQDQRHAVRTIPERTHLQSARNERHRLFCAPGQSRSFRGVLFRRSQRRHDLSRHRSQGRPDAAGRSDQKLLPVAALVHLRRRRAVFDRGRLSDLLPRIAQWRRTRRRPADRSRRR